MIPFLVKVCPYQFLRAHRADLMHDHHLVSVDYIYVFLQNYFGLTRPLIFLKSPSHLLPPHLMATIAQVLGTY